MIWVDYAILAILFVSALISVLRGFLREALSLAGWILAFWVAFTYSARIGDLLFRSHIDAPSIRQVAGFFVIFALMLLLTAVVMFLVRLLIVKTEISGTDRALGIVFGLARGVVIVCALVLLAGLTAMPRDPWWRESVLLPHFQVLAVELRGLLPHDVAANFRF